MSGKPKVLFLSRGNSTRSQMGEGFLNALADDHFVVMSAGVDPGGLNPFAVEVMKEVGIDISGQQSRNVAECLKEHFAYVITVSDSARERAPIFPGTPNLLHWSLTDPSATEGSIEAKRAAFRKVRDQICREVQLFVVETLEKEHTLAAAAGTARR